jgi:hypothetical protein
MSANPNNFYTSDEVTVEKVTFKNQYQMAVAGNIFRRKPMDRDATSLRDRGRAPDGRGQGAERESVRDRDGRAGVHHVVAGPVVLGQ